MLRLKLTFEEFVETDGSVLQCQRYEAFVIGSDNSAVVQGRLATVSDGNAIVTELEIHNLILAVLAIQHIWELGLAGGMRGVTVRTSFA